MNIFIPSFNKPREKVFIIAYTIYMVYAMLSNTFFYAYFPETFKYVLLLCILLLLMQEFRNPRMARSTFWGFAGLYSIVLLIMLRAKGETHRSFACVFAFAVAARTIDFKKIARVTLLIALTMIGLTVISALLGIIPNYLEHAPNRDRYYIGYLYSLYGPAYMLNATLLVIYIRGEKIRRRDLFLLFLANYWIFRQTDARLSFYMSVAAIGIGFIMRRGRYVIRLQTIARLLIPSYIVSFLISVGLSLFYSSDVSWLRTLNYQLGGRFHLGKASLAQYGVSLFGNSHIEWVGHGLYYTGQASAKEYSYVDSLYLQFLQRYGLVFVVVFLILLTMLMYVCYKRHDYMLVIILAFIAYHGIIDNLVLYLHFNTFWLLIGPVLFGYLRQRMAPNRGLRRREEDQSASLESAGEGCAS